MEKEGDRSDPIRSDPIPNIRKWEKGKLMRNENNNNNNNKKKKMG